jgi:hypothetical protein
MLQSTKGRMVTINGIEDIENFRHTLTWSYMIRQQAWIQGAHPIEAIEKNLSGESFFVF